MKTPLVVAYGMGVDSTAMLVGLHARGVRPDLILFADTGNEKPETYAYLPAIQAWLQQVGFPAIITVRYRPKRFKHAAYSTLEGNCLANSTLPSLAFGRKGCSLKWKRAPQDAYVKAWQPAQAAWAAGGKVLKAIGYDNGPKDSKRAWKMTDDRWHCYWYPLRDWGWDRAECTRQIAAAGLPVPMKSACWFCPASKPDEIAWLMATHPELADRIVAMETRAAPGLKTINGLWRKPVKGTRGGVAHPGSMSEFINAKRLNVLQSPALDCGSCGA